MFFFTFFCYWAGRTGIGTSSLGITLYILLAWSYTVAVFVDPGSPAPTKGGYNYLPAQEAQLGTTLTVKSTGGMRYCKKCQARKPDRAHHCSTCRRCILKMDHHCPWLATCLGLRNYKAFVLFLVYTSLFCWACFAVAMGWIASEVLAGGGGGEQYNNDTLMPVNILVLAVVSGVFGLALSGFTGWHIMLALQNQTTIERLEKTRYLSAWRGGSGGPARGGQAVNGGGFPAAIAAPKYEEQLQEMRVDAGGMPGAMSRAGDGYGGSNRDADEGDSSGGGGGERRRPWEEQQGDGRQQQQEEEDEGRASASASARDALRASYAEMERHRERERYERYLDEQDSEKLPHAFDLGWRANLRHLLGPRPLLWALPVCNTIGDGWHWESSARWHEAQQQLARQRAEQRHLQQQRERDAGWGGRQQQQQQQQHDRYHY